MTDAMANNMATPRSTRAAALERRRALSHSGGAVLGAKKAAPARAVSNPTAMGATASVANVTGKSLSRARREALSQRGAGLAQAPVAPGADSRVTAPVMSAPAPLLWKQDLPPAQDAATHERCSCGCKEKKNVTEIAEREEALEAVCAALDDEPAAVEGPITSAVRKLCRERRRALSSQGKMALSASSPGGKRSKCSGLSGRDAARSRREDLCQRGRGDGPACRPAGRARPKPTVPVKVETGTTLRGTGVTGTQVERSGKVTGNEPGSCRAITGTEYIGAEQYGEWCAMVPEPAPAKISLSNTSRGQRVSGTEVGLSVKVTGDEHGACKTVTGIEYLSADHFESFCGTKSAPAPAKVSVVTTEAGQSVSGAEAGRSAKMTGDEAGAYSKLTGSQYIRPDLPANLYGSRAPRKVSVMRTVKEHTVTGSEVGRSMKVTGDEHGACTTVTGTEYAGLEQYQACNRVQVPVPEKVGVMSTWHGQPVSGTAVEHSSKVTGDEYGGCQPVSGTEYIGPDQYAALCDDEHQAASRALTAGHGATTGAAPSGTRVASGGKVTGAERGEALVLSGTPYSSPQQRVSQRGMNSTPHPLARAPFDAPRQPTEVLSAARVQGDFSIATPARSAQGSDLNRITGTAYGAIGRITGPVNLAAGLVSGTPEFRYRDEAVRGAPMAMERVQAVDAARSRLTGDGREGGFAITGAAWRRNESVTGTEGVSTRRNPTLRGDQRGIAMGAAQNKDRERPEVPVSKITGSSGNDVNGSAITYSGGARG
ncbi:CsoS2 family carboxysome shell protein [Acidithiobacillus sp.]|uniref:CsoS2 family carboxysome shell protein n=1 Tax=Acidithiobacillus sp. TaxID=1872118 RepID=UPI0025B9B03F|nr:CsoS2 family carboxysome shell protein [Acidithiobacillus sp.]MCK9188822.1 transcriptional initiation protein Tat [Acidithiobacillus sp.]MCK9358393.1 transcriptional initiation protein Tat [Acidithiobacillus sp.]